MASMEVILFFESAGTPFVHYPEYFKNGKTLLLSKRDYT
jgi:hypothetical protein